MNAVALFKMLGDETRYNIVCMLYRSDSYVELIAEKLKLTPGTVCFHLKKLESIGLVKCSRQQFYIIYSLNREMITESIENYLEADSFVSAEETYREKVLASFFHNEKLLRIPVQEKKREIVLAEIMKDFTEPTYEEKQVNEIIRRRYEDFCTLRRWLISDGFMMRDNNIYTVIRR